MNRYMGKNKLESGLILVPRLQNRPDELSLLHSICSVTSAITKIDKQTMTNTVHVLRLPHPILPSKDGSHGQVNRNCLFCTPT